MHLLKAYFKYMKDPSDALSRLLEQRSVGQACCGYLMAALGWVIFFNVGDGLSVGVLLFKILLVLGAELTAGYFIASLAGLFLDFKNSTVSPAQLFVLVGLAGWIKGLLVVGAIFSAMFPQAQLGLFAPLFLGGVFLLQLGFLTRNVVRVGNVSVGTALMAWVFGIVPVFVLFALVGVFLLWGMILLV